MAKASGSTLLAGAVLAAIAMTPFCHGSAGSRYSEQEPSAPDYELPDPSAFDTCTDDCSGHQAGYDWAEDQGIEDPDDCSGNSDSFVEGCQAYAEEAAEQELEQSDPDALGY